MGTPITYKIIPIKNSKKPSLEYQIKFQVNLITCVVLRWIKVWDWRKNGKVQRLIRLISFIGQSHWGGRHIGKRRTRPNIHNTRFTNHGTSI